MTKETWLPVVGFEHLYEVSDLGRVRSLPRLINDSWGRSYTLRGKNLNGSTAAGQYPMFRLHAASGVAATYLHDMVAAAFIGEKPKGCVTRHLDDDPTNNTPGNLAYGSQFDNMRDAVRNDKMHYGEKHPNCVYSEELIRQVKDARSECNSTEAEQRFGVSARYVREIWAGEKRTRV